MEKHSEAKNGKQETPKKRKKESIKDTLQPAKERKPMGAVYTRTRGKKKEMQTG